MLKSLEIITTLSKTSNLTLIIQDDLKNVDVGTVGKKINNTIQFTHYSLIMNTHTYTHHMNNNLGILKVVIYTFCII